MNCFIHTDKEAVAKCKKCGRPMCIECLKDSQNTNICPSCNIINKVKNLQILQNNMIITSVVLGLFVVFFVLYVVNIILDMFSTVYLIVFTGVAFLFGLLAVELFTKNLKKLMKEKQDIMLIQMANKRHESQIKEQQHKIKKQTKIKAPKKSKAEKQVTQSIVTEKTENTTEGVWWNLSIVLLC